MTINVGASGAKILVTGALLWAVFSNVDRAKLGAALAVADPSLLLLSTGLYALTFVVGGIRWWGINRSLRLATTLGFCVRIFFVSGFLSQVVIGGGYGGDIYRIWRLTKEVGSKIKSAVSVLVDRVSGLMAAVLVVCLLAPAYWVAFPQHANVLIGISLVSGCAFALVFLLGWVGRHRGRLYGGMDKGKLVRAVRLSEISNALVVGFFKWPATGIHLSLSLVALAINMLALGAIGRAIHIELGVASYLILGPIVFLAKSFPLSVAGWGAREVAMVYFFGLAGIEAERAFAMSLLAGVLVLLASSIGGVLWLITRREALASAGHK